MIYYVASEVERMRTEAGLEKRTSTFALQVLKQIIENEIAVNSYNRIAATCFYAGCKITNQGISLAEIEEYSRSDAGDIASKTKEVNREAGLGLTLADPIKMVERCCEKLSLSPQEKEKILSLTREVVEENAHVNKPATTVAGSTIYGASVVHDFELSQGEVAETVGITSVTIRNNFREILRSLEREFPPDVLPPESVDEAVNQLQALNIEDSAEFDKVTSVAQKLESESGAGAHTGAITAGSLLAVAEMNGRGIREKTLADTVGTSSTTLNQYKTKAREILNE